MEQIFGHRTNIWKWEQENDTVSEGNQNRKRPMIVYRCETSMERIFTAVYRAYEEKRVHEETIISLTEEPLLFAEDIWVEPDERKVCKVINTLNRRFGQDNYLTLCMALASEDADSAQAVYRTIVQGLAGNVSKGHLFDNLADDYVHRAFALARTVNTEIGHQKQFLRFGELENGVLYSRIGPKNDVVVFLMPHFADRLPMENFMIYDDVHNLFGIHPAGRPWYLLRGGETELPIHLSEEEIRYQELFRQFCHTITIEERKNTKLQRNMLPLRFRKYMVEFS